KMLQAAIGVIMFEREVDAGVVEEEGGDFALAFPVSVKSDPLQVGNAVDQILEFGERVFGVERDEDRPAAFREKVEQLEAAFAARIPGVGFRANLDGGNSVVDKRFCQLPGLGKISGVSG